MDRRCAQSRLVSARTTQAVATLGAHRRAARQPARAVRQARALQAVPRAPRGRWLATRRPRRRPMRRCVRRCRRGSARAGRRVSSESGSSAVRSKRAHLCGVASGACPAAAASALSVCAQRATWRHLARASAASTAGGAGEGEGGALLDSSQGSSGARAAARRGGAGAAASAAEADASAAARSRSRDARAAAPLCAAPRGECSKQHARQPLNARTWREAASSARMVADVSARSACAAAASALAAAALGVAAAAQGSVRQRGLQRALRPHRPRAPAPVTTLLESVVNDAAPGDAHAAAAAGGRQLIVALASSPARSAGHAA